MTRIDGSPGVSKRSTWTYRGVKIIQTYRTHDVRNKTHNGFDWKVVWSETAVSSVSTRAKAKVMIDEHFRAIESQREAVRRPAEERARSEIKAILGVTLQ